MFLFCGWPNGLLSLAVFCNPARTVSELVRFAAALFYWKFLYEEKNCYV